MDKTTPTAPSRPTIKRLFALSGNRCAFPKCVTPLVDPSTGSIVGEVCHIKGEKAGSARHDREQSGVERQAFENLVLLCNVHHKVVDDDELAYTATRLIDMKRDHEFRHSASPPADIETERFVNAAIANSVISGSVIATYGQSGGQTAHSITNIYNVPADEEIRIDGKLDADGDLDTRHKFGCAGLRLTVACRSQRPANIQSASMLIRGVDILDRLKQSFGTDFGATPIEGTTQVFSVQLIPISPANSAEGYVLNRDDVCRFFYPLPIPPTRLALESKPDALSIEIKYFDDSVITLLDDASIRTTLESAMVVYGKNLGRPNCEYEMGIRMSSRTPPNVEKQGHFNSKPFTLSSRSSESDRDDDGGKKVGSHEAG